MKTWFRKQYKRILDWFKYSNIKKKVVYIDDKLDIAFEVSDEVVKLYIKGKLMIFSLNSSKDEFDDNFDLSELSQEQLIDLLGLYEEDGDYAKCAEIRDLINTKTNS